jgi:hypothetical protein
MLETTTARVSYTGAGTTGPFSVPFYFLEDNDLSVIKVTIADGTETSLVLTTDYTVSGAADPDGGSVTLVASLSSSYKLVIIRDPDALQSSQYPRNDPFPSATHERVADKLTMLVQRLIDRVNRSFRLSDGDTSGATCTAPIDRANKALIFDADGNVTVSTDDYEDQATAAAASAATATAAASSASTSASGASTSAATATTQAGNAATSASTASTSAGNAATSETNAATSATAASNAASAIAPKFTFDSSTSMADPGAGDFRLNNATVASATALALSANSADSGNPDVSDFVATWAASTNTAKGTLTLKKSGTPATFATFTITGVTDNGTWLQLAVTHVASNGAWSAADVGYLGFARAGDKGADGAGSGDMLAANNLSDVANAATAFGNIKQAASETATGVVELATVAEATTGTDTSRAVTPAGVAAALATLPAASVGNVKHAKIQSGFYTGGEAESNFTVAANRLYFWPIIVPVTMTIAAISVRVATASAGNVRVGLYADSNGLPSGAPLYDAGTASTGTTGIKDVAISQSIPAGLYWGACVCDATPSLNTAWMASLGTFLGPFSNLLSKLHGYYQSHTYGALPTVGSLTAGYNDQIPSVWLKG